MKNIVILWWFWKWNYWDNFILFNEIFLLKELIPESKITVLCWSIEELKNNLPNDIIYERIPPIAFYRLYKFLNIFYLYRWIKLIIKTDILILWWWGFFSDRQKYAIPWWLRWCEVFSLLWSQVYGFWMWMWPFYYDETKKKILKSQRNFQKISLRDDLSLKYLELTWFDKKKIIRTIDPAYFTPYYKAIKNKQIWFIIRNNPNHFIKELQNILKYTDYNIVLIIMDTLDIDINKGILQWLQNKKVSLLNTSSLVDISTTISSCDFVVSQRLHGNIISFTQKVPFLNIYYHHKWAELWKQLNISKFSIDEKTFKNISLLDYINMKNDFNFMDINLTQYKTQYIWKIN